MKYELLHKVTGVIPKENKTMETRKEHVLDPKVITREYLLKLLSEEDYLWLAREAHGDLYAYKIKPVKDDDYGMWALDCSTAYERLPQRVADDIFDFIKWSDKEPFSITKALNKEPEINWREVPVDTLVYVSDSPIDDINKGLLRYFAGYDECSTDYCFSTWAGGRTSKTTKDLPELEKTTEWQYCKLAEIENSNK